jgi:hypothetical protein
VNAANLRRLVEGLKSQLAENPRERRSKYPSGRKEIIGYQGRKKIVGRKHKKKPMGASLKRLLSPPKLGL